MNFLLVLPYIKTDIPHLPVGYYNWLTFFLKVPVPKSLKNLSSTGRYFHFSIQGEKNASVSRL